MAYWRRRRSIIDIFDEMMREIESIFEDFERQIQDIVARGAIEVHGPYIYGFRMVIGPDGRPIIEEFGNIRRGPRGRVEIREEIEPLVDVFEEDNRVVVIAELPGVDKDKIEVKVSKDGTKLIIRASNGKKYYKEIELPARIKPETVKARYRNGVLEVTADKVEATKREEGEYVNVKVE